MLHIYTDDLQHLNWIIWDFVIKQHISRSELCFYCRINLRGMGTSCAWYEKWRNSSIKVSLNLLNYLHIYMYSIIFKTTAGTDGKYFHDTGSSWRVLTDHIFWPLLVPVHFRKPGSLGIRKRVHWVLPKRLREWETNVCI